MKYKAEQRVVYARQERQPYQSHGSSHRRNTLPVSYRKNPADAEVHLENSYPQGA